MVFLPRDTPGGGLRSGGRGWWYCPQLIDRPRRSFVTGRSTLLGPLLGGEVALIVDNACGTISAAVTPLAGVSHRLSPPSCSSAVNVSVSPLLGFGYGGRVGQRTLASPSSPSQFTYAPHGTALRRRDETADPCLVGGPLGRLLVQGGDAYHERLQPSETADRFTVSLARTRWSGTASPAVRRSVPPACRSRATGRSAAFLPFAGPGTAVCTSGRPRRAASRPRRRNGVAAVRRTARPLQPRATQRPDRS